MLTTTPKPSEYASERRRGRGESCDSFVPSSFPVGNSTWRRPLHTPNTILALDVCIHIYASDDCVFITHTTRNSLTFFRRVLCATSRVRACVWVRVGGCVCVCVRVRLPNYGAEVVVVSSLPKWPAVARNS